MSVLGVVAATLFAKMVIESARRATTKRSVNIKRATLRWFKPPARELTKRGNYESI